MRPELRLLQTELSGLTYYPRLRFRGEPVTAYRVYCLDGVNRFVRAESVEASDDEGAIRLAREVMGECVNCEVWERDRLVTRLSKGVSE